MSIIFWCCLACVLYAYAGYPLCLAALARWRPKPVRRGDYRESVSFVVAARNEAGRIGERIEDLRRQCRHAGVRGEIIVVSDGSTDATAAIARRAASAGDVRLIELTDNMGKAAAVTMACQSATGAVLAFADCRQRWTDDALARLLDNFADPTVGAVSGDLVLEEAPGLLAGVGLYWRFEKWLRRQESLLHSQVGVTGAIAAVRRELFRPIPTGILLDDVYWPLQVALQGRRVIHDERAQAVDRLPEKSRDEFRRKIRTLAGNFQLVARLPAALVPWRNPVWWQLVSHKLLRLAVPWLLLAMLATSWLTPTALCQAAFWTQLACYALGFLGLWPGLSARSKLLAAAGSFLVLNAAAWLGFWVWISGRCEKSWTQVHYRVTPAAT